MNWEDRSGGFTLIEVIIAVVLVAIMAVTVTPPMVQNIRTGKITRAQNDAQAIGTSLLAFHRDVGEWPALLPDGRPAYKLIGNETLGGGKTGVPRGTNMVSGSGAWDNSGRSMTLTQVLIKNSSANGAELFEASDIPQDVPGWNGPYVSSVPLDPWGNPYAVNIRWASPAVAGTITADNDKHNLLVVSAGPNRVFETPLSPNVENEFPGGDDVAYIFHPASRY